MKTKILSLVLFLLTTLGATAESVSFKYYCYDTKSWVEKTCDLGKKSWTELLDHKGYPNEAAISWDPNNHELYLKVSNMEFESLTLDAARYGGLGFNEVTVLRLLQPMNALMPMNSTKLPRVMDVRLVLFSNDR